jgi:N-acetylmuramoyl-L-alanine amidase
MNSKIKGIAAALVAVTAFSLCSFTAGAVGEEAKGIVEGGESTGLVAEANAAAAVAQEQASFAAAFNRWELAVSKVYNKNVWAYSSVGLTHNGRALGDDARMINGMVYVPVRSFINSLTNMTVTYYSSRKTLNVKGSGFEMDIIDGSNVIYANGRALFSMSPSAVMSNGKMYAPLSLIAKALSLDYQWNSSRSTANLTGSVKPLTHANSFYASDAVYWLSRIISAESRGESLLGQIAVGNVVMNRVKSTLYPNTIWGVIFDRKYGVQFSPIIDGSIYMAPTASAIVAAKICLEGYRVNSSMLFFLYPTASTSSWIPNNRTYLFSIGKHDFYA